MRYELLNNTTSRRKIVMCQPISHPTCRTKITYDISHTTCRTVCHGHNKSQTQAQDSQFQFRPKVLVTICKQKRLV